MRQDGKQGQTGTTGPGAQRDRRPLMAAAVLLAVLGVAGMGWGLRPGTAEPAPIMPAQVDIAAGEALYAAHCASCHGARLEGQPDWQTPGPDGRLPAPPHDAGGHTWHHPDSMLFRYTQLGGREVLARQGMEFDSGMPGFGELLTDRQIWDVLAFIKSTWPERQRQIQAARSAAPGGAAE